MLKKLSSYYLCNRKTAYLNPPLPAGGCIFHLTSYFRRNQFDLTNRCSERRPITFVSRGVPVSTVAQIFSLIPPNERGITLDLEMSHDLFLSIYILNAVGTYPSLIPSMSTVFYRRAPQQMLRTHLSLEGLLCNRMRKMKMMMSFFSAFRF